MTSPPRAVQRAGDGLSLVDRPPRTPAVDEVLVGVTAVTVRPDDLDGPDDLAIGRSAVGIVEQVGAEVTGWQLGDRVALPALTACGRCGPCQAGRATLCTHRRRPGTDVDGWALDRVVAAAVDLQHVPLELEDPEAAAVPGPVAAAYHALKRGGVGPEVTAVVVGAGATAALLTQLGALAGGRMIALSADDDARERALDLGADDVLDPGEGLTATLVHDLLGDGVDRVLLPPGSDLDVGQALGLLRRGGRVVLVDAAPRRAGDLDLDRVVADELDVVGATGATGQDVTELFDLAADGRLPLAPVVGTTVALDALHEVPQALRSAPAVTLVLPR